MKRFSLIALSLMAVFSLMACGGDSNEDEDRVVATVDDAEIMESELKQNVDQMKMQYEQYYAQMGQEIDFDSDQGEQMLAQIEEQALESLIQQEILYQEAQKAGIEASEDDVDKEIETLEEQYESEEELDEVLEENGLTMESYKELLEQQLVVEEFTDEEVDIEVTDEDIDEAYEEYKASAEQQGSEVEDKSEVEDDLKSQVKQEKEQTAIDDLASEAEKDYDIERNLDDSDDDENDEEDKEDRVIATVDDKEIMESEWQQNVDQMKMQYEQMGMDFDSEEGEKILAQIEEQSLESLIRQEVLYLEAENAGIEASQDEVDKEIESLEEEYGSEEDLEKALEESGMTLDSYKELLEEQLVIEEFIDEEVSVEVTDEDIDEAYEEYKTQTEEQDGEVEPKEDMEDDLTSQVEQEKEQEAVQKLYEDAKEDYDIERNLEEDDEE